MSIQTLLLLCLIANVNSVKAKAPALRESKSDGKIYQLAEEKFMHVGINKGSFNVFLSESLEMVIPVRLKNMPEQSYFIAGGFSNGRETKVLMCKGAAIVDELNSSQEEADSHIILHMQHTNDALKRDRKGKGTIIIRAHDTDIVSHIQYLWIEDGYIGKNYRWIPIHNLCAVLQPHFLEVWPALDAMTGCDCTSSFYYRGKCTVFEIVCYETDVVDLLTLKR